MQLPRWLKFWQKSAADAASQLDAPSATGSSQPEEPAQQNIYNLRTPEGKLHLARTRSIETIGSSIEALAQLCTKAEQLELMLHPHGERIFQAGLGSTLAAWFGKLEEIFASYTAAQTDVKNKVDTIAAVVSPYLQSYDEELFDLRMLPEANAFHTLISDKFNELKGIAQSQNREDDPLLAEMDKLMAQAKRGLIFAKTVHKARNPATAVGH